jgi:membrane protease YdiL (CAAX protease family)
VDRAVAYAEVASAPVLGPKRVFVVFLAFFGMQVAAGAVIGFLGGLWYVLAYGPGPRIAADVQRAVVVPAALAGQIVGGLAALRMARRSLPGPVGSGALVPIGWSGASAHHLVLASAAGGALALVYLFGLVPMAPPSPGREWGPLVGAVTAGGWSHHLWAVLALVVAPPVEEFVFRGVAFTGFREAWGPGVAGVVVTLLFVASHFSEIAGAGPAVIGVALVGSATLLARIATGSLAPAIVLHASYNLGLVIATYVGNA